MLRSAMRRAILAGWVVAMAGAASAACGGGGSAGGFPAGDGGSGGSNDGSGGGGDGFGSFTDGNTTFPDGGSSTQEAGTPVALIYAHSPDTLYRLDANTKQVAIVGTFSGGCTSVIDIAIDSSSNGYVTTNSGDLWKVDLKTAACTHISTGNYPNSLSFVPKGTLDPNVEALVGYVGSQYIRIDTTTGAIQNIGTLKSGYSSSGDIVSVIGAARSSR